MKAKILLTGLILLTLIGTVNAATCSSIEQFGITWTFDKEYECGQFTNGDYWVVGPVIIVGIDPPSTEIDGRTMNGSMINPSPIDGKYPGHHGWDNALGYYRAEDNVALDVSTENHLAVPPSSSLLSSITHKEDVSNQIKVIAILTVLSEAPATNSFRPPYSGADKTINHNVSDLNYSSLGNLTPTTRTPNLADIEAEFEKPWIDYWPGSPGKSFHPTDSMSTYGRDISVDLEEGALMLQLNFSNAEKETLMIRMTQIGIDNYGITQDTGGNVVWVPDGGHGMGRKFPIMFAGTVLNDENMLSIADKSGDYINDGEYGPGNPPPDYIHFQEDASTFYVSDKDIHEPPYELHYDKWLATGVTSSGNVLVTNGSADIVGVGETKWDELYQNPPDYYYTIGIAADNRANDPSEITGIAYVVKSIDDASHLTLTEPYDGDTDQTGNAEYLLAFAKNNYSKGVYYGYIGREFISSDLGIPEWGIRHSLYPYQSNPAWDFSSYRHANANIWMGWVLAAQIMGMKDTWNHDALFDYTDRYDEIALIIKEGMDAGEGTFDYDGYTNTINWRAFDSAFTEEMWDTYRADYGDVWTAATPLPECIDLTALTNNILGWKQGSLSMVDLMQKISLWKAETGC